MISSKVDHDFGEVRIRDKTGHDIRVVCKLAKEARGAPSEHQSVVVVPAVAAHNLLSDCDGWCGEVDIVQVVFGDTVGGDDEQIAGIVARAQLEGIFRTEITPEFGALAFYGSIEQVLTRWIFDRDPVDDGELEGAKTMIVETICRGLERD